MKHPLDHFIQEFEIASRAAGLSEKTISWYTSALHHYQTFIDEDDHNPCTVESLRRYFVHLQTHKPYSTHPGRPTEDRPMSVATILAYGRALKRFCNWLVEESCLESSPMSRIRLPRQPKHIPKDVSLGDINAMLNAADNARDKAIVLFLTTTGVRASELLNLRFSDIDFEQRLARVRGKGNKDRFVIFDNRTATAILKWSEERQETTEDWVFTTIRGTQLTYPGLREVLRRLKAKAGVDNPVSAHRFRHAFAKRWMMNGGDEFSLAAILGHEDIATTRIYSQYRLGG